MSLSPLVTPAVPPAGPLRKLNTMNDKTRKIKFKIYVETCRGQRLCVLALFALEDQLLRRWRNTAEL